MPFVSTVRAVRKSNSEPFSWKSVTSHNCVQVPLSVRARHRSQKQRHMKNRKRQNTNENVCVYITVWNVDRNHGTTNNKKISLGHNTILDFFLSVMCVSAFASSWNHKLRLLTTTRHALNIIEYAIRIAVNEQRSITAKKQFFFLIHYKFTAQLNRTFIIGRDKSENILMAQHDSLVDFCLAKPWALLAAGEDFDGHKFAAPASTPHFAKSSFADHLDQLDLTGDRALHQQRKTGCKQQKHQINIYSLSISYKSSGHPYLIPIRMSSSR